MKISNILKEQLSLYQVKVFVKVDKQTDRAEIFNNIRGIPNVVICKPKDSDVLDSKETEVYGYSYIFIKFISNTSPIQDMKMIKHLALKGGKNFKRINGLYSFKYNPSEIEKV